METLACAKNVRSATGGVGSRSASGTHLEATSGLDTTLISKLWSSGWLFGLLLAIGSPVLADISGTVVDDSNNAPIAGARVHLQADPASPVVITAADGSYSLPVSPAGPVVVTAAVEYDALAAVNYNIEGVSTFDGATGVEIRLPRVPTTFNSTYAPFLASDCGTCHVDQFAEWQTANHSLAATDEWVLDLFSGTGTPGGSAGYVFRDLHDPADTGFCATCHAPVAEAFDPGNVFLDEVTGSSALEGVNCVACHQLNEVNENVNALHILGNATYHFPDDPMTPTWQFVWGPLDDVSFSAMRPAYAPVFSESRFCASCHQYNNPTTGAPGQNTYGEWLASPFASAGPLFQTCQDCHMPTAGAPGTICDIGGPPVRPGEQRASHDFVGATPATLASSLDLVTTADASGGLVVVRAEVDNFGLGHSFPTGVSIRNAMLVINASIGGVPLTQVSGPTIPFWADDDVPGKQPGDLAGEPGKGFAKVLEGRINGTGPVVRPVLFIDAESVFEDSLIPAASTDVTEVVFALPPSAVPGQPVDVTARLLYRRAYRALAVTKGWTETPQGGPIEIEVAADTLQVPVGVNGGALAIPTLDRVGLMLLVLLLVAAAVLKLRSAS